MIFANQINLFLELGIPQKLLLCGIKRIILAALIMITVGIFTMLKEKKFYQQV